MGKIAEGEWSDEIESGLGDNIAEAIDDFGPDFDEEGNPIEEGESDRIKSEEEREKEARDRRGRQGRRRLDDEDRGARSRKKSRSRRPANA